MRRSTWFASLLSLAITVPATAQFDYPDSRRGEQVDDYHGTMVPDPYRWLENDVREDQEVAKWVEEQNVVAFDYLESLPDRQRITDRLTELWDYERFSAPFKRGGRYYFTKNDGLQNQSVVFVMDELGGEPSVLLDPNAWSEDGTIALGGMSFSDDGRYVAYARSESGSDWRTWYVMDLRTGDLVGEPLEWIKWSGAKWTKDGQGFFYSRFAAPEEGEAFQESNLNQKLYYHRVGTPQSDDVLVYHTPHEPEWGFAPSVSEDGRHLVITLWKAGRNNSVHYLDLTKPYGMPTVLIEGWDASYGFVGNDGSRFLFWTDKDAPNGRVIALDLEHPDPERWETVIAESENTLESVDIVGGQLVAQYLQDACTSVKLYSRAGAHVRDVELPGLGTASGFSGKETDTETFYSYSSFDAPPSIYRYDMTTGESSLLNRAEVDFDPDDYVVQQIFYESKDGTRVPMFVSHKKGVELDGDNPTLLYGYGGFSISLTPRFSVSRLMWMELGGIFAQPNLRGGGEYGEAWHVAGTKLDKQNVFDDFIAAAEWLIDNGYTRPAKLAVQGGSNGGLLVGAVMTQRPDLFGAAIPEVGVMDMLRFHKFTAGRFWTFDYGSSDNPEEFQALLDYSPYHNIEEGTSYPATLITTADTDDRVVPGHSFKFAAAIQRAQAGPAPVLIRIETSAGHGAGKPTTKRIAEVADKWAFIRAAFAATEAN